MFQRSYKKSSPFSFPRLGSKEVRSYPATQKVRINFEWAAFSERVSRSKVRLIFLCFFACATIDLTNAETAMLDKSLLPISELFSETGKPKKGVVPNTKLVLNDKADSLKSTSGSMGPFLYDSTRQFNLTYFAPAAIREDVNDIAVPYMWLKADVGVTGSPRVTGWADQSGNNRHATESFPIYNSLGGLEVPGAEGPVWVDNVTNFNPGLRFDASNTERLDLRDVVLNASVEDLTIFAVFNTVDFIQDNIGTNVQNVLDQENGTFQTDVPFMIRNSSKRLTNQYGPPAESTIYGDLIENVSVLAEFTSQQKDDGDGVSNLATYLNGKQGNMGIVATREIDDVSGVWYLSTDRPTSFDGHMHEVIIYDKILTDLERLKIQSYLAIKYGLTLSNDSDGDGSLAEVISGVVNEGDYLDPVGNKIWTSSTTYQNDIGGIGYEAGGTDFEQLKSKSINPNSFVTIEDANGGATAGDPTRAYLIWGDDAAATTATTSDVPSGSFERMERKWKIEYTNGGLNGVSIQFDLTGLGYDAKVLTDFALIRSADATMANGSLTAPTSFNGGVLTFEGITFPIDESYFSISVNTATGVAGVLSGLQTWLRADEGAGPGPLVPHWADQSGLGNNAEHSTLGPDLVQNVSNFNPGLLFDAANSELLNISNLTLDPRTEDLTVFSVFSTVDNTADQYLLGQNNGAGTGRVHMGIDGTGNTLRNQFNGSNQDWTQAISNNTTILGGYSSLQKDNNDGTSNLSLYSNGALDFNTAIDVESASGSWILGTDKTPANYFNGHLNEVIVYNEVLSAKHQLQIESYLAIKYGLTLTNDNDGDATTGEALSSFNEGDYLDQGGNKVWDYSMAYHNDIAGLGYSVSGLSQLKSKSQNSNSIITMEDGGPNPGDPANGYLIWGNDAGVTTSTTSDLAFGSLERMTRIWRIQYSSGGLDAVTVRFDLTGLGFGSKVLGDFGLIVSDSETMADGAVILPATLNGDILTFEDIDFTAGSTSYFTLSLTTSFNTPAGIGIGLANWLRADAGITGTTAVTLWEDQSINGRDASHGSLGPELTSDVSNFNPGLRFDRSNGEKLDINDLALDPRVSDLTVFTVLSTADNSLDQNIVAQNDGTGTGQAHLGIDGTGTRLRNKFDGSNQDGTQTIANNGTVIAGYSSLQTDDSDGISNLSLYLDGALDGSASINVESTDGTWILGADKNATNNFDGYLSEIIVYDRIINPTEQLIVESYLALKYGLTLTNDNDGDAISGETLTDFIEGDYLAPSGNKIWNSSITYHHNIAGMGYDPTPFLKLKSKSEESGSLLTIEDMDGGSNPGDPDLGYLIWGNDAGVTTSTTGDVPAFIGDRMTRVWRVEYTNGGLDGISIQFDLTGLGYDAKTIDDFQLIVSSTSTMADGSLIDPASWSGSILTFDNIDFTVGSPSFFTISLSRLFSPGGVSNGLGNWLRADVGVTGTTVVTNWADQSANGLDASDSDNVGLGPELKTSEINFNPAVYFDYTNNEELILGHTLPVYSSDMTIFSPFVVDEGTLANRTVFGLRGTNVFQELQTTSSNGLINYNLVIDNFWSTGYVSGRLEFVSLSFSFVAGASADIQLYRNGSLDRGIREQIFGPTKWVLGNNNLRDSPFSGDIPEIIFYDRVLDDSDRRRVDSYLAIKYGVTQDNTGGSSAGDYVASDNMTTFWRASTNAGYHNDVAGIGWDRVSVLNQKQSKSINTSALVTIGLDDDITPDGLETSNALNNGSFSNDLSFLMWGNNGAELGGAVGVPIQSGVNSRLNRQWRVQETGTVGTVTVQFELSTLPHLNGVGANDESQIVLLVSDEADFQSSTATVSIISQSFVTEGDDLAIFRVDFPDGAYFTLGSAESYALPITLLSFEAAAASDHVKLEWSTAAEVDNVSFDIERRTAFGSFESIGSVAGAGTTDATQYYSFEDHSPEPGRNYYRLVDFSVTGKMDYSEVILVEFNYSEEVELELKPYPNPVKQGDDLVLKVSDVPVTLKVQMYNTQGQLLWNQDKDKVRQLVIPTAEMEPGIYIVRCALSNGKQSHVKIIIQ